MAGSLSEVLSTAYGWTLLCKITVFAVLLSLAAQNKLKLVPAQARDSAIGGAKLRRSIKIEGLCVLAILIVTATLTSVTTPPVNL
jgi:putative copper resistance protein D